METRHRRRGGKSAQAAVLDPLVQSPSPVSESTVESEGESEAEWADVRATGVRDHDPPTTTLPGDDYQTPPAGARARIEGALAAALPSPSSLAQGGLATSGDERRGPDVVIVDPASPHTLGAEAINPVKSPDPSAGQQDQQAIEVQSPTQVKPPEARPLEVTARNTPTFTLVPCSLEDEMRTLTHAIQVRRCKHCFTDTRRSILVLTNVTYKSNTFIV